MNGYADFPLVHNKSLEISTAQNNKHLSPQPFSEAWESKMVYTMLLSDGPYETSVKLQTLR